MSKAKKQIVHVCVYSHKHGVDVGVYKTPETLESTVADIMAERSLDWDDGDKAKFNKLRSFSKKLALFHEVEQNISYGETLEIFERELR